MFRRDISHVAGSAWVSVLKSLLCLPYLKIEAHIPLLTDRGTHPIASLISLFWDFSDPKSSGLLQLVEAGLSI